MSSIILPPMSKEDGDKFKTAVNAIGHSLNAEITCEEVVSLKVSWQNNRGDVATVINNLAEAKTKKKYGRGKDIKIGQTSEDYSDSKNL